MGPSSSFQNGISSCFLYVRQVTTVAILSALLSHYLANSELCDNQDKSSCHFEMDEEIPDQSMALVLYDEKFVSPFHKERKVLKFGSNEIVILQDWKNLGVAAVVWDAVSPLSTNKHSSKCIETSYNIGR